MSHSTVLVIGEDPEKQLEPFQEFGGGGKEKYVQEIDETEEKREEYNTGTVTRMQDAEGKYHVPYDPQFYREPTAKEIKEHGSFGGMGWGNGLSWDSRDWGDGMGYRAKISYVPEGFKEVKVKKSEIMSFRDYITEYEEIAVLLKGHKKTKDHKYHYCEVDGKGEVVRVIHRTIPDAKWDWCQLGGRWSGFFKLKSKTNNGNQISDNMLRLYAAQYRITIEHIKALVDVIKEGDYNKLMEFTRKRPISGGYYLEKALMKLLTIEYPNAKVGETGLGAKIPEAGWVDSAYVKDIDFKGMMEEAGREAGVQYDKLKALCGGTIPKMTISWEEVMKEKDGETTVRDAYHNQPAKQILEKAKNTPGISDDDRSLLAFLDLDDYQCTREEYVRKGKNWAISTFAILQDGKWTEKATWSYDEEWSNRFNELILSLPGDTLISVYDCHS